MEEVKRERETKNIFELARDDENIRYLLDTFHKSLCNFHHFENQTTFDGGENFSAYFVSYDKIVKEIKDHSLLDEAKDAVSEYPASFFKLMHLAIEDESSKKDSDLLVRKYFYESGIAADEMVQIVADYMVAVHEQDIDIFYDRLYLTDSFAYKRENIEKYTEEKYDEHISELYGVENITELNKGNNQFGYIYSPQEKVVPFIEATRSTTWMVDILESDGKLEPVTEVTFENVHINTNTGKVLEKPTYPEINDGIPLLQSSSVIFHIDGEGSELGIVSEQIFGTREEKGVEGERVSVKEYNDKKNSLYHEKTDSREPRQVTHRMEL